MVLDHDGYAKERPILVADDLSRIEFTLENRFRTAHRTELTASGLPAGAYVVTVGGKPVATVLGSDRDQTVALAVNASPTQAVTIVRR